MPGNVSTWTARDPLSSSYEIKIKEKIRQDIKLLSQNKTLYAELTDENPKKINVISNKSKDITSKPKAVFTNQKWRKTSNPTEIESK